MRKITLVDMFCPARLSIAFSVVFASIAPIARCESPATAPSDYHSPYSLKFSYSTDDLIGDLLRGPLADVKTQATIPFSDWYSEAIRRRYGAWGPPARSFLPPDGIGDKPAEWKRQRVIAVASQFIGVTYQHHHLPAWNPPSDWPWLEVEHGSNAPGVDCSNFSGLIYNMALGLRMSTDIEEQANQSEIKVNGEKGRTIPLRFLKMPPDYAQCVQQLHTGDLLYILNNKKEVSHCIIWLGNVGQAPDNSPLVIDSTGSHHKDCDGRLIPDGVQLRPFKPDSWYFKSLSHVHRIIDD